MKLDDLLPIPCCLRPFRFQVVWLTHKYFDGFLAAAWHDDWDCRIHLPIRAHNPREIGTGFTSRAVALFQKYSKDSGTAQSVRANFLIDGDCNSTYYHLSTLIR
ncbi:hypothetical protein V2J09_010522 [Rumex salicifolius]